MKPKLETLALGLFLAPPAPLAGLMVGWWLSYELLPEKWIPFGTIGGFLLGLLADLFILKKLVARAHTFPVLLWMAIFLFYAIGMFGFFMGVPVFHAALAIPAGIVIGGRLAHAAASQGQVKVTALRTSIFTSLILFLTCAASATFALVSPSTSGDLKGMLGLGFEVTPLMIWGLILVGGAGLLAVNWALTEASVRLTYRFLRTA